MTFWETIERGEYVMFPLAILFLLTIAIWWARGARLRKQQRSYYPLMMRLRDHVVEGDLENAIQLCEISSTPGAKIIEAGLHQIGKPMAEVREVMKEVVDMMKIQLEKGEIWLRFIAVIAPLIGLAGSLVGIIDRLRDLGETTQSVTINTVCENIAPTIVTTVAGLGVGIFALFALACLLNQINGSKQQLQTLAIDFQNLLNEPS